VLDPRHYDGPSTPRVTAPPPLGRMGRRLQEIAAMPVAHRPIDLYAALAGAARWRRASSTWTARASG